MFHEDKLRQSGASEQEVAKATEEFKRCLPACKATMEWLQGRYSP